MVKAMSKQIQLSNGGIAVVDDDDYDLLSKSRWTRLNNHSVSYAMLLKASGISMHRIIMGLKKGDTRQVDHIDGDGLNNRKSNLRVVTRRENSLNRKLNKNNTSGHRGVEWDDRNNTWRARITVNNRQIQLGRFENKQDAVTAYEAAADKYFGEFRRKKA
jgi:hypothetical protein